MDEEVVLLLMLKLLQDARNMSSWRAIPVFKRVRKLYFAYNVLSQQQKYIRKRKFWVRPMFTQRMRHLQGASDNLIIEMQTTDPEKFFNYFRMSMQLFEELLALVGPRIEKQELCRVPISSRIRLQVTLRWLASGDSLASHSYAFRIGANTASKIVKETCTALWEVLKDRVFLQPIDENWQRVADDFERICQFSNCIGAIDGKHIMIQAPPNSGSSFYNYKGNHSINLLAVSDANCCFSIVDIGAEGRRSDAGVFASSNLAYLLDTSLLQLPPARHLDNSGIKFPYVLVGDEAFPLSSYMMRPYPRSRNLSITQKIFNYRLSRARRSVECAFGILAARWRIFRRPIIAHVSTAKIAVQAATAVHNFVMKHELQLQPKERQYSVLNANDRNVISTGFQDECNRNRRRNVDGIKIRDAFATYFETSNPLSWQWRKALNNEY